MNNPTLRFVERTRKILGSWPEVFTDEHVGAALRENHSVDLIALKILNALARCMWVESGELYIVQDSAYISDLNSLTYKVLGCLADAGSSYVTRGVVNNPDNELGDLEPTYLLVFSTPFADFFGNYLEEDHRTVLGVIYPGNDSRHERTLRSAVMGIEAKLTGQPEREVSYELS